MSPTPTDLDERWATALRHPGPAVDLDVAWAAVEHRAKRAAPPPVRSRRPLAAVAVVLVLLVGGLAVWRTTSGDDDARVRADDPPAPTGRWERLPDLPIPPRSRPSTFDVGHELFVVGGSTPSCASTVACRPAVPNRSDGAALDVRTGTWRRIAVAPEPIDGRPPAVIGEAAYFLVHDLRGDPKMLRYDPAGDTWSPLPPPTGSTASGAELVAAGDRLVAFDAWDDGDDYPDSVYDPAAETWTELPPPPDLGDGPTVVVGLDDGLVVVAYPDRGRPDEGNPAARLDLDARRWRSLPAAEVLNLSAPWLVDGGRLVCAASPVDRYGRDRMGDQVDPACDVLDLDTDTWSELPDRPEGVPGVGALGTDGAAFASEVTTGGVVFDLDRGRWVRAPRLDAAEPARPDDGDEWTSAREVVAVGRDAVAIGGIQVTAASPIADEWETDLIDEVWIWRAP